MSSKHAPWCLSQLTQPRKGTEEEGRTVNTSAHASGDRHRVRKLQWTESQSISNSPVWELQPVRRKVLTGAFTFVSVKQRKCVKFDKTYSTLQISKICTTQTSIICVLPTTSLTWFSKLNLLLWRCNMLVIAFWELLFFCCCFSVKS